MDEPVVVAVGAGHKFGIPRLLQVLLDDFFLTGLAHQGVAGHGIGARFSQGVSEEYVDVREKLTDYDEEREGFASGIRKRVAQLLRRDPKWNDLSPRDRVRFLLTLIYRKNVKAISGLSGLTAREALEQVNTPISDAVGFAALYDKARYSSHDITQDEAEKARRDVKL